ncbi:MAG: hypothetical protein CSA32_04390 [Desulfobulbus propionicus]|nr:MAG: hypothetical protein CSA32_04390 [Desulfobulbus propionicus]
MGELESSYTQYMKVSRRKQYPSLTEVAGFHGFLVAGNTDPAIMVRVKGKKYLALFFTSSILQYSFFFFTLLKGVETINLSL